MTIGEKIKMQRKSLGLTQTELGAKLGVQKNAVSKWECGRVDDIPSSKIKVMAQLFGVQPSYLIDDEITNLPSPAITEDTITFPIVTSVAAHYDSVSTDESATGEHIEVPAVYLKGRKPEDFCAMRVRGDSMYPDFRNGDIVLVLKQSTMNHSGEIGVISYGDDEMTIKRINYVDGEDWLKLVPLNPAYPPRRIEGVDLESCHIIGIPQVLIREY